MLCQDRLLPFVPYCQDMGCHSPNFYGQRAQELREREREDEM